MRLPSRILRECKLAPERECNGSAAFWRACCVPGFFNLPIECGDARSGSCSSWFKPLGLAQNFRLPSRTFQDP
jgi:hypothetical protein